MMSKDVIGARKVLGRYQHQIIAIFKEYLSDKKVELYVFGSRATGTAHKGSDMDIAVRSENTTNSQLSKIREALHQSHIPYKIEVVDFNTAGEAFKKSIDREGILIWEN